MELRQLVKEVPYLLETKGDMSVEIAALCSNSRGKDRKRHLLLLCRRTF